MSLLKKDREMRGIQVDGDNEMNEMKCSNLKGKNELESTSCTPNYHIRKDFNIHSQAVTISP